MRQPEVTVLLCIKTEATNKDLVNCCYMTFNESSLQSCQDDKRVYLVHCNRCERCHLPQPCPSRPQGKLILLRTWKSKGVVDARSTLVIWVQNSIIFCFSSKLRHFLEKSLEDTVASWSWLAGSQIWLILNGLLERMERVIDFCKTGEWGFPLKVPSVQTHSRLFAD